jgi:hypothetical protein
MSVIKSLGVESLFGDVQRMDKRQVRRKFDENMMKNKPHHQKRKEMKKKKHF